VIHGDPVREQAQGDRARRELGIPRVAGGGDGHRAREHRAIPDPDD